MIEYDFMSNDPMWKVRFASNGTVIVAQRGCCMTQTPILSFGYKLLEPPAMAKWKPKFESIFDTIPIETAEEVPPLKKIMDDSWPFGPKLSPLFQRPKEDFLLLMETMLAWLNGIGGIHESFYDSTMYVNGERRPMLMFDNGVYVKPYGPTTQTTGERKDNLAGKMRRHLLMSFFEMVNLDMRMTN